MSFGTSRKLIPFKADVFSHHKSFNLEGGVEEEAEAERSGSGGGGCGSRLDELDPPDWR